MGKGSHEKHGTRKRASDDRTKERREQKRHVMDRKRSLIRLTLCYGRVYHIPFLPAIKTCLEIIVS